MKISLNPFSQNGKDGVSLIEPSQTNPRAVFDKTKTPPFLARPLSRSLMKINLITLLLGLGLSQVDASTYAQQVTLKRQKTSLEAILKDFEKQSGYTFFYKKSDVSPIKGVDVDVKNMPLNQALNNVLKNANFTFEYFDKTIVIKKGRELQSQTINRELPTNMVKVVESALQEVVRGQVLDESGNPIKGASIREKSNPKRSVVSQEDGTFNMPITALNEIIVISYLGYQSKEVKASLNQGQMVIRLAKTDNQMEEVVISTGIFKKEDKSFTGASTTITAEQLKQFGTRNLITSLRNIEPSFNIIESNAFGSNPNRLPEIQIRGNSNIPNVGDLQNNTRVDLNTPLIILDGFQSSLQKLLDINENDVQSITILKDAAATAMYGSRGANGVVVITTKMPTPGKLRVSFGTNINIENPDLSGYDLLDAQQKLELEKLAGYYNSTNAAQDYELKSYYNNILSEVNRGVNTDWLSIPLRTSTGQRHNLRVEGGDGALRYAASFQYNNIAGVMKGSNRNTYNGGIMLSYNMENVRFRNNTQISQGKSSNSPYGTFSDYAKLNPYWAPYDNDGNVNKRLGYFGDLNFQQYWGTAGLPTNPLYNASLSTYDKSEYTEITNNTSVEWNILRELLLRSQFGFTKNTDQSDRFRPAEHTAFANYGVEDLFRKGDYRYGIGNSLNYDGSINLAYNKVFEGNHNLYVAGDFNVRQSRDYSYNFLAEGFSNPRLDFLSAALQYAEGGAPTGSENFTRSVGFSGNASYNFNNRYFTDFVFRYDGSSQFGSKQKFAPFWSYGLGWNVHEENFMKGVPFVNRLKLRGSTGTVGSQSFSAYQAMSSYRYYSGDSYYNWAGAYLLALGNEDLKWQQTQKHNLGADIELLNNRIKVRADIYREITNDLVSSVNIPSSNGFDSYVANIGKLRNIGFETQLTFVLLNNMDKRLFWSLTGNILRNRNKVLETSQALKDALLTIKNNSTNIGVVYEEGYSSNTIWVVPSLGIDPSNGKEVYLDLEGNPTYQWNGRNVVAAGNTDPKLFGNFSTMVRYKDFSINAVFRYTTGGQQYNNTLATRVEASDYKYQMDARVFEERWKYPGDEAAFKGLLVTTPTYKTSRLVHDEKTLILSNVNLQYDLRKKNWMKGLGLQMINITGNISEPLYMSTIRRERGTSYPFSRQYTLGFNATF